MLRTRIVFFAGFAATLMGIACGDDTSNATSSGGTSSGSGGGGAGTPGLQPPPPPPKKPGDGTGSTTFAISKLYLGDIKRNGQPDKANGWKEFGYDLDGIISECEGNDCNTIDNLCKPAGGGNPANAYPDGNNGIDNSFGSNILSIILSVATDASTSINNSLAEGAFTIMLDVDKLGSGNSYNPLTTGLFGGGDLGHEPNYDGTDEWPLIRELLIDGDPTKPKVKFDGAYVTDNVWVSGSKGDIDLSLSVSGYELKLTIASALISFKMDAAHENATEGTIAGVLATQTLLDELQSVVGNFDPGLCQGTVIEGILNQIKQASDIMKDGGQDPTKECDGISIGLGFDARVVKLGSVLDEADPAPNPCADPE